MSLTIPTLSEAFSCFLHMTFVPSPRAIVGDSSALFSSHVWHGPREELNGDYGSNRAPYPKCVYCHKWGHTKDKCYKLHGCPPHVNLIHINET